MWATEVAQETLPVRVAWLRELQPSRKGLQQQEGMVWEDAGSSRSGGEDLADALILFFKHSEFQRLVHRLVMESDLRSNFESPASPGPPPFCTQPHASTHTLDVKSRWVTHPCGETLGYLGGPGWAAVRWVLADEGEPAATAPVLSPGRRPWQLGGYGPER